MRGVLHRGYVAPDCRSPTLLAIRCRWPAMNNLLRERYGGRRAFLHHLASVSLMRLGCFHEYRKINWSRVERLVFVCKGNICRSAYAAARASSAPFPAVSFGIAASPDVSADASAIAHAAARNVSLSSHRTTSIDRFVHQPGDLLVCMEPLQAKTIARIFADSQPQVTLLGLWARPARPWLWDPYGGPDDYWCSCLNIIDSGIDQMLALIRRHRREG